jgi:signal transduction histidine kinase/DNA-binding response OmpR family regulator
MVAFPLSLRSSGMLLRSSCWQPAPAIPHKSLSLQATKTLGPGCKQGEGRAGAAFWEAAKAALSIGAPLQTHSHDQEKASAMKRSTGLLPWFWALLAAGGIAPLGAQDAGLLPVYILEDDMQQRVDFADSLLVYFDSSGEASIQDVLGLPDSAFARPPQAAPGGPPFVVWARLRVKNNGKATRDLYFSYCAEAEAYWTYSVAEGEVLGQQYTGKDVPPGERALPARYLYTPASLDAGAERTYFFKLIFTGQAHPDHWAHLSLRPQQLLHHYQAGRYAWQAFYAGVMLLFCAFSLFLFSIFREKSFIYFALQTWCFVFYFMEADGVVEAFFTNWFQARGIHLVEWAISGIVVTGFLFISQYLQLSARWPKYYVVFLAYSLVCAVYLHVAARLGIPFRARALSHNTMLVLWVVLCVAPMVLLAFRGEKAAKILLSSIGAIALGALLFLVGNRAVETYSQWGFVVFQAGTILSSGIVFYGLFDRINAIRSEKQRMEELDELKSRFFANISHEFRTPLTLMMGPLQQLAERADDPEQRELLAMAQRNASRQLALVNQLLELSTLEEGKMELGARTQDFIPFLKGVVQAYDSLAEQQGIELSMQCPEGKMLAHFSEEKMETVFYNLLSNAFKFTAAGGRISVVLKREKGQVAVTVSDTGVGIAAAELPHIFERFFRAEVGQNEGIEGSGIGLALAKELMELHGGSIKVESELGQGTRFFLHFPLAPAGAVAETTASAKPEAPLVLVIEDNEDVRAFIRLRLKQAFRIAEAVNGQAGIDRALDIMPDLIISDVMMPEKDGYEVCQALKTDLRTCHIPIILLTAKAAQAEKLAGLETGADDYLTKPFDSKELLVRAENLIQLRQQLRQRFADSISLKPSEVVTNSRDQAFLEQVLKIVEDRMADEQFSVDVLASEAGMSRTNLNRKLRALVNQSSNQFIQSVRLQRAADLLRQQTGTVAEIAFQTGFSSTAYFVKCFKDKFGQTPGSFSENS